MDPNLWYEVTLFGGAVTWTVLFIAFTLIYLFLRYKTSYAKNKRVKLFKKFLIVSLISLLIGYMLVTGIREVTAIPRPCIPCDSAYIGCNEYCTPDFSFPSGHTVIAFIVTTSLVLVARSRKLVPLYILAALVGISRVFLGVHYMGDVIAGASLGTAVSLIVWRLLKSHLKM